MYLANILEKYKKYDIEYNIIRKILTINKIIPKEEFKKIKKILKKGRKNIKDILEIGR